MLLDSQQFDSAVSAVNGDRATSARLLNIGCGNHYHADWVNLDLISDSIDVTPHDITCGLPFVENSFDAVYHSHLLEHLNPNDGIVLLEQCYRVLKPGGIVRIVVPDLERIAMLYLETHDRAWRGDKSAKTDYDWMKLELLDQLVREQSGGQMGQFMTDPQIRNSEFVRSRVGDEYRICRNSDATHRSRTGLPWISRIAQWTRTMRESICRRFVSIMLGPTAESALSEGLFRSSGEVHRWMYDRFSLRDICGRIGFVHFQIRSACDSQIPGFERYHLDVVNGEVRKPDSLFVECTKPHDHNRRRPQSHR